VVLVGAPLWGATDASLKPAEAWERSGHRRTTWVTAQAVAAPFLFGFPISLLYAARVRGALVQAASAQSANSS
jgi:hypothetical protein